MQTGLEMDAATAQIMVGVGMVLISLANLLWTSVVATRTKKIDTLEDQLKIATGAVIETKLGTLRAELMTGSVLQNQRLDQIDRRLDQADVRITRLDEHDHKLEVDVLKAINELKDVVATKNDLDRLREEMNRDRQ